MFEDTPNACSGFVGGVYNYWLSPNDATGEGAFFEADLGCCKMVNKAKILLTNVQSGNRYLENEGIAVKSL